VSIAYYRVIMPAPSRTSADQILYAARAILEEDGLDAVTMQAVATRVGVKSPSLYKRVADRAALIKAVADAVTEDLRRTLDPEPGTAMDPPDQLRAIAYRFRTFVHANPQGYALLFAPLPPDQTPDAGALAAAGRPIVDVMGRITGGDGALEAARTMVAWAHGFVTMELAGGFRLGGDLTAAYDVGIETILAGVSARATPSSG
jgi:AcrR family transcriptional regulator